MQLGQATYAHPERSLKVTPLMLLVEWHVGHVSLSVVWSNVGGLVHVLSAELVVIAMSSCLIFLHCGTPLKLMSLIGRCKVPLLKVLSLLAVMLHPLAARMLMVTARARLCGHTGMPMMLGWSCKIAS